MSSINESSQVPKTCIGCAIASGELVPPGGILLETKHFLLHQDPDIPIPAFLIITARRHVRSLAEMDRAEVRELADLLHQGRRAQAAVPGVRDVTIIQEERSKHFHAWLFPRYAWMDDPFESGLPGIRAAMRWARENQATAERAREIVVGVEQMRAWIGENG